MRWLDHLAEKPARAIARRTSRRSSLGSLGMSLVGAAALPLLPVARGSTGTASPWVERDNPLYVPSQSNDYNWCSGNPQASYHCSAARIVGIAK